MRVVVILEQISAVLQEAAKECHFMCAELDVDVRWAGEPDVLLKLEPSTKWITNAVKIGMSTLALTSIKHYAVLNRLLFSTFVYAWECAVCGVA